MNKSYFILMSFWIFFISSFCANADSLTGRLTRTFERTLASSNTPGGSAVITINGKTIFSIASGKSVVSTAKPFTTSTLSSVASVTKLITSTIVMRMVEDGLLTLDDTIDAYVPSYIPATKKVTIRNLLSMKSGYADIEAEPAFIAAQNDPNHQWTREELFTPIKPPKFSPGTKFEYSNVNFLLLSQIIDNVYSGGVSAAFQDYIAKPARLGNSVVFDRIPALASRFAHGYNTINRKTIDVCAGAKDLGVNTSVWGTIWGDGGIGATAGGLAKFANALFHNKLVKRKTLRVMMKGAKGDYGLGMYAIRVNGHNWFGHAGAFNGYTAWIGHDLSRDVTITLTLNALDEDTGAQLQVLNSMVRAFDGYVIN